MTELNHMPSTEMTQEQMEVQTRVVSEAVDGDPGEEEERYLLEDYHKKPSETVVLIKKVFSVIQSIKGMTWFAEESIEKIEHKVRELESEIASNRQV